MKTSKKLVLGALLLASQAFISLDAATRVLRNGKIVTTSLEDRRAGYKKGLDAAAAQNSRKQTSQALRAGSKAAQVASKRQTITAAPLAPVTQATPTPVTPEATDVLASLHPSTKRAFDNLIKAIKEKRISKEDATRRIQGWKASDAAKNHMTEQAVAQALEELGVNPVAIQPVPAAEQAKVAQALNDGHGVVVKQTTVETPSFFARHKVAITVSLIAAGGVLFVTCAPTEIITETTRMITNAPQTILGWVTQAVETVTHKAGTLFQSEEVRLLSEQVRNLSAQVRELAARPASCPSVPSADDIAQALLKIMPTPSPAAAPTAVVAASSMVASATPSPTAAVVAGAIKECSPSIWHTGKFLRIGIMKFFGFDVTGSC